MPTLGGAQTAPSAEGLDAAGDDKGEDFDPFVESLAKGHVPDKLELEGANHPMSNAPGAIGKVKWLFFDGGTPFDAFLTAASAQVGQVILTLPHSLAETNIIAGTFLQLTFATWAMYTMYLLVILYLEYKNRKIKAGTWYTDDGKERAWATQYYEVVGELVHKWAGIFALIICILAALGSCIPQIVASSANVYRINDSVNKRDWAIIFGPLSHGFL